MHNVRHVGVSPVVYLWSPTAKWRTLFNPPGQRDYVNDRQIVLFTQPYILLAPLLEPTTSGELHLPQVLVKQPAWQDVICLRLGNCNTEALLQIVTPPR